jgi:hypothetical protein
MIRTKVDPVHVETVLNDAIADAMDKLCAEYGIQMIEWYYPYDGDAETAFTDFAKAVTSAIEQTMSWYADDEE